MNTKQCPERNKIRFWLAFKLIVPEKQAQVKGPLTPSPVPVFAVTW